ncbi:MAG: Mut7-C RNAse domain-containing protein [Candidatus Thermoplasmatota archaeon]|jgi:uncharacterized protein with PIN domain|nr:Mut7-C RNAse domain-containing protein [Candidatus Thermoplasmatota archaeon]
MIIVDSMLGKLARYLRMIGYDVEYIGNDKDDSYIISISKDKLILTRDKQLHERLDNSILLKSYSPIEQLAELRDRLPSVEHGFMELCSLCGGVVERTQVRSDLPDYVSKQATEIFYCKSCDKYYWNGSHTDNFRKMLERIGYEVH